MIFAEDFQTSGVYSLPHTQGLFKPSEMDTSATLDDLREAVTMLEDIERIARRVLGDVHPFTNEIEEHLPIARANLRARETPLGPGA